MGGALVNRARLGEGAGLLPKKEPGDGGCCGGSAGIIGAGLAAPRRAGVTPRLGTLICATATFWMGLALDRTTLGLEVANGLDGTAGQGD